MAAKQIEVMRKLMITSSSGSARSENGKEVGGGGVF